MDDGSELRWYLERACANNHDAHLHDDNHHRFHHTLRLKTPMEFDHPRSPTQGGRAT